MKIYIASDHAGIDFKQLLQKALPNFDWIDLGPAHNTRVDYPDYAQRLCQKLLQSDPSDLGILICGSGIGMSIAANKIAGIRAALVNEPISARLSKEHNDSNVLCLGARFIAPEYAAEIVNEWIRTPFSNDPRHLNRIQKIALLEERKLP